jgi:hypothetical protein
MFDTELRFGNVVVRPDFEEVRRTAREFMNGLCDIAEVSPHERARLVREFEEKSVLEMTDMLVELYGPRGD